MFVYTLHTLDKLKTKDIKRLKITKKHIERIVQTGFIAVTKGESITRVGPYDVNHSLCVVYKNEEKSLKIITFFPAEKGRYESKILH